MDNLQNPYQTPQSPLHPTPVEMLPTQEDSPYGPMRDSTVLGRTCQVLLGLYTVLSAVYVVYSWDMAKSMSQGVNPFVSAFGILNDEIYYTYMGMSYGISILFILNVIFFCIWTNRSMKNAWATPGFGFKPSMTPGWAVGWYFIPIMQFFRPLEGMKEIWERTFRGQANGSILTLWWTTWIIGSLIQRFKGSPASSDLREIANAVYRETIGLSITIVAGVTLAVIVGRVTKRQVKRYRKYSGEALDLLR